MNQERKLSFFLPPISPVKDANGKNVTPATLVPHKELTLKEVWNIVTGSPRLKKLDVYKRQGVDYSGKDLVRACFLSHDERDVYKRQVLVTVLYSST